MTGMATFEFVVVCWGIKLDGRTTTCPVPGLLICTVVGRVVGDGFSTGFGAIDVVPCNG